MAANHEGEDNESIEGSKGPRIVSEIDAGLTYVSQMPNYSLLGTTVIDLNLHCNSITSMKLENSPEWDSTTTKES